MRLFLPLLAFFVFALAVRAEEPSNCARASSARYSHVLAFTTTLTRAEGSGQCGQGGRVKVVAAYPQGSKDIESSTKRVPEYTRK